METNLESSFGHAKMMFEQGNFNTCNKEMLNLINLGYKVATCQYYIGLIYLNLKRYDDAVTEFSKCIKIEPQNIDCLYALGIVADEQKNNDLALHYYYKVLNINPNHTNAKNAINRLKGNPSVNPQDHLTDSHFNTQVKTQDHQNQVLEQSHFIEAEHNIPQPKKSDLQQRKKPTTLYDELTQSNDKDSQIAVEMINATQMLGRKFRYSAYIGPILLTLLIILTVGMFPFFIRNDGGLDRNITILEIICISILIYQLIKIKSTVVTIDNGFIEIKTGVVSSSEKIYYVHKTEYPETYQNFFNLLTGDGTFILSVEISSGKFEKIELKGLGKIDELKELKTNIQNLRIQLRNTPVIKSGIYG